MIDFGPLYLPLYYINTFDSRVPVDCDKKTKKRSRPYLLLPSKEGSESFQKLTWGSFFFTEASLVQKRKYISELGILCVCQSLTSDPGMDGSWRWHVTDICHMYRMDVRNYPRLGLSRAMTFLHIHSGHTHWATCLYRLLSLPAFTQLHCQRAPKRLQ